MESRVKKWVDSVALRTPKLLAVKVGLDDSLLVELSLVGGALVTRFAPESDQRLDDLLAQVTEENLYSEFDTGPTLGTKAW